MRKLLFVGILATLALGGASQAADGGIVGSWRFESIGGAQDFDSAKTSLEVTPEDNISMTIGCNRMTSIPAIEGDNIDFGPVAATRMACPDPLGALEQRLQEALAAASNFTIEGDTLQLRDDSGDPVAVLVRTK